MNNQPLFRSLVLLLLVTVCSNSGFSKHIIGGYTYYEHLTGDRYSITMLMYRDCNDRTGADFDRRAPIGIFYRADANSPYNLIEVERVSHDPIQPVRVNKVPCIEYPSDTCAELGIYRMNYTLDRQGGDYAFAYQRCCRNDGIENIVYERCGVGSTFFVEITEAARNVQNNSPQFRELPPVVICSNFDFEYDNSAIDSDGDLLTYEFCAPKNGGGLGGIDFNCGNTTGPTGTAPDPPTAPPFRDVLFDAGYSSKQPVPGNPPLTIDMNSGIIDGQPNTNGLFTVGVCINEYRNGALLGTYIRDFQFYVNDCNAALRADINEDYIDTEGNLVITRCGEKGVFLRNTSQNRNDIFSNRWLVYDEGSTNPESLETFDLTKIFDDYGEYNVQLLLNEGELCADTADILLNLFPGISADFEYEIDSCEIKPIDFTSTSVSELGQFESLDWDFDDGSFGSGDVLSHLYFEAGYYDVSLEVRDSNDCVDRVVYEVPYFPTPELLIISPNIAIGCVPQPVIFDNLTDVITDEYTVIWDFGDGTLDTALSPTHIYDEVGEYSVSVKITSPLGCELERDFSRIITINPSPTAAFDYSPKEIDQFNSRVDFENLSSNYTSSQWRFGDGSRVNLENPSYDFPDTGFYLVELLVKNDFNCLDTAEATIDVYPKVTHFLPTAFTPNLDGTNDIYRARGDFGGIRNYSLKIYDRYGQMIFESNDPLRGWDGINANNGKEALNGGYIVVVEYNDSRNNSSREKSFFTLLK